MSILGVLDRFLRKEKCCEGGVTLVSIGDKLISGSTVIAEWGEGKMWMIDVGMEKNTVKRHQRMLVEVCVMKGIEVRSR